MVWKTATITCHLCACRRPMQDTSKPDAGAAKIQAEISLKWAFAAYDRFVARLSPGVRRHLGERREDAYTVVFGRTQVGKSTLILHLLGVRPDAMSAVSNVLRGGRKAGNSATALPMEYRRSRNDRWGIRWGRETWHCDADDEARDKFAHLRTVMESDGAALAAHLCDVEIPARYFDEAAPGVRGTRVLDLPGAEAANANERRFVARIAESLVPNADLILLVGRGDDLSFLMADQLELPGIADWQLSPRRFRVVTTYSFTPASVREFASETGCVGDAAAYRERLIGQIQRFRTLDHAAQAPELYYPLEFGDSWKGAADLHNTPLKEMMEDLMQGLRQDIAKSSTPMSRLEGALDAHVLVAKVHAGRLDEIEKDQKRLQDALGRRNKGIAQLDAQLAKQGDQLKIQQAEIAGLTDAAIAKGAAAPGDQLGKWAQAWRSETAKQVLTTKGPVRLTDPLLSAIGEGMYFLEAQIPKIVRAALIKDRDKKDEDACEDLFKQAVSAAPNFWERVHKGTGNLQVPDVEKAADRAFSEIRSTLEGYWIKYYVQTGPGSQYKKDIAAFSAAHLAFVEDVSTQLTLEITAHAKAVRREMLAECHRLEMQSIETRQYMAMERSAAARIEGKIAECRHAHAQAERFIQEEVDLSRQFTALLAEEYEKAVEKAYDGVLEAPDAVAAFEQLVFASMLRKSHESVWTRISGMIKQ